VTPADFFAALRLHLRARHVPHDAADLLAWCQAVWPVAEDDPDPGRWADAYAVALAEANRLSEAPLGVLPGKKHPRPWRRLARRVGRRLVWLTGR
jgi:hypothetical protein